jgi:hypothetical protein
MEWVMYLMLLMFSLPVGLFVYKFIDDKISVQLKRKTCNDDICKGDGSCLLYKSRIAALEHQLSIQTNKLLSEKIEDQRELCRELKRFDSSDTEQLIKKEVG